MKLLIAEKPSVAVGAYRELLEKIEGESFVKKDGYLQGKNYVISWCVGHLIGLAKPDEYPDEDWGEWKLDNLPMLPNDWKHTPNPSTIKQYKVLASLCKDADLIINGGDAGREGELIVALVLMQTGTYDKPTQRLWLSSFVMSDMEKAWKIMKDGKEYHNLTLAGLARARADWLVGMNASRFYSLSTKDNKIAIGRVQTPTLAIVVKRDLEIANWVQKFYFQLEGLYKTFKFTYFNDDKLSKFDNESTLKELLVSLSSITVAEISKTEKTENPPLPFNLPELQKAANKKLGYKAAKTLEITQKLYEQKLVTYPRTDSSYLPEAMVDEAFELLQAHKPNKDVFPTKPTKLKIFNSAKVSDHYAIIPTMVEAKGLSKIEQDLYDLIVARFTTAFAHPHKYEQISITAKSNLPGHFKTTAKLVLELGYKALIGPTKDESEEVIVQDLPFTEGMDFSFDTIDIQKKEVKKPSPYTEASLLTAMETCGRNLEDEDLKKVLSSTKGIGTPATKAGIIEGLKRMSLFHEDGKKIISSAKGKALIELCNDKVKSPELTGEWEQKLSEIENGSYEYEKFISEIENYVKDVLVPISQSKIDKYSADSTSDLSKCPSCGAGKLKDSPKVLVCDSESCEFKLWKQVSGKKLTNAQLNLLMTKGETKVIKGFKNKEGKSFDAHIILKDGKMSFKFPEKEQAKSVGTCPKCKNSVIVSKYSYQCKDYKNCDFKINLDIAKKRISEHDVKILLEKQVSPKIEGFISKKGARFTAQLEFDADKKVKFKF